MAYAVLASLAQTIDHIPKHKKYPLSDLEEEIALLRDQVVYLQKFVLDYPQEASSIETRMRNAANRAEDVIEHFMYEHIRSHHKFLRLAAVGRETSSSTAANIQYDFRQLKKVMEEMKSIHEAAAVRAKIVPVSVHPAAAPAPAPASTPTPTLDIVTVGLEESLKKIIDLVCADSPERQIIPITGMGGIGKTTLANKVYNDPLVMAEFPVRAWVTVSQAHKPEKIFEDLLYSLEKVVEEGLVESSDSTADKLHKILTMKKFLLIVDDIWSEEDWDGIRRAFGDPNNLNGSRIVITTSSEVVASRVSTSGYIHKMRLLTEDQSWSLLEQKVFPVAARQCPSPLKEIGEGIATSCGGLPLAIVLVAGILSNVGLTRQSWEEVATDVHSAVDNDGGFRKRISLSYTYLPIRFRPCFLYMGGFPEDYEIRISKLIKLWIAEGFVKDEEEAEKYLSSLMTRNLALVTTIKSNGKVKSCNIHDMVRELCKEKALDENYQRRLSTANPDLTRLARAYASTLRSVLSFQSNEKSLGALRKFRLLRVLDVVDTDAYSLPAPVFELFHLRYLSFGCPMETPAAIARLQNLRALVIRPSKRLRHYSTDELYLPVEIWMLPLLRHLVSFFDLLPSPEGATSALENLLTLSVVKKLICTQEMMKMIPNVKKLVFTYIVGRHNQLHNLVLLHQLEKLTLVVKKGSLLRLKTNPVLPTKLRKLTLSGWQFPWKYMEVVGTLPNLQVLKLRDYACKGDVWETDEEQFAKLEYLLIDASDLKNWDTDKSHFPNLKRLVLHGCAKLNAIPDVIGDITPLELIEVDRANSSLVECVQRIQMVQIEENDNTLLQVRAL